MELNNIKQNSSSKLISSFATIVGGITLTLGSATSAAALTAIGFTSVGSSPSGSIDFNVGFEFTVGASDITVTDLGFFDATGDGLSTSHTVGIFRTSDQALVTSELVDAGSGGTLDGFFRYDSLGSGVVLDAGETYRIAGTVNNSDGDSFTFDTPGFSADSAISFNGDVFNTNSALTYPGSTPGSIATSNGLFGPNFMFTLGSGSSGGGGAGTPVPFEFSPTLGIAMIGSFVGLNHLRRKRLSMK